MKKFLYSLIIIGSFTFYAIFQNKLGTNPNSLAVVSIPATSAITPTPATPVLNTPTQAPISNDPPSSPTDGSPTPTQIPPPPSATPIPINSTPQPTPTTLQPTPTPIPTVIPTPTPKPKGMYADGQYTGSPADAYYGNIQVEVTISGGKITDVVFLQYPNDRSYSRYVNGQAMPYLKAEAIAAQSANVDVVSGATDSSQAFQQSLASALVQAKS